MIKRVLRQAHRVVVWYSVIAGPITVAWGLWLQRHGEQPVGGLFDFLNDLGFLWILSLLYVFLALVFYKEFRESLLSRLAGFRENDEREELVTAHAARSTFLLMLALQIVMLAMSLTNVHLLLHEKKDETGHRGLLTLGMNFSSSRTDIYSLPTVPSIGTPRDTEIKGYFLPPNMTLIFLLMILVQIGSFKMISRRRYEGAR